jgi:hypothetical protein
MHLVNYYQIFLFLTVAASVLLLGMKIYQWFDPQKQFYLNRYLYLGEALLLGSIGLVGGFVFFSLISLYRLPFLLGLTLLNFLWLFDPSIRKNLRELFFKPIRYDVGTVLFLCVLLGWIFRNCFFQADVDSFSTYLFSQKLWIENGSSLLGKPSDTFIIFLPQFDQVLNSLGLALFPGETLYPAFIGLFWRVIVLILLFGYAKYKFRNTILALSTVSMTVFNDHFFYSGVNHWVLINGALLALLFAAVYNFWEARTGNDINRFVLACVFLSQTLANKYQMAYAVILVFGVGFSIQNHKRALIVGILQNKIRFLILAGAVGILSLWFLKNFLITGDPVFPGFAGRLHAFGWTPEQASTFMEVFGGIGPETFLKYMSFLFVWPGIKAAKLVLLLVYALPFMFLFLRKTIKQDDQGQLEEFCYWLGISMLTLLGICLMCHQDSRFYRYLLPVFSFAAIYGCFFLLTQLVRVPRNLSGVLLFMISVAPMANEGLKTPLAQEGGFRYPTFAQNIKVLTGRIKTGDVLHDRYPDIAKVLKLVEANPDKFAKAAWDMASFKVNIPQFWLPQRPVVSVWYSNLIHWDSYADKNEILKDFRSADIEWVIEIKDTGWGFTGIEEYAEKVSAQIRFPSKKFYAYSEIEELDKTNFK